MTTKKTSPLFVPPSQPRPRTVPRLRSEASLPISASRFSPASTLLTWPTMPSWDPRTCTLQPGALICGNSDPSLINDRVYSRITFCLRFDHSFHAIFNRRSKCLSFCQPCPHLFFKADWRFIVKDIKGRIIFAGHMLHSYSSSQVNRSNCHTARGRTPHSNKLCIQARLPNSFACHDRLQNSKGIIYRYIFDVRANGLKILHGFHGRFVSLGVPNVKTFVDHLKFRKIFPYYGFISCAALPPIAHDPGMISRNCTDYNTHSFHPLLS